MKRLLLIGSLLAMLAGMFAVTAAPAAASSAGWICQTKYASQYEHCDQSYTKRINDWAYLFNRGRDSMAESGIYNFVADAKYRDANDGGTRNADMCALASSMSGNSPGHAEVYATLQAANAFYSTGVVC